MPNPYPEYEPRYASELERGFAYGVAHERERIIKLIEDQMDCLDGCDHYDCGIGWEKVIVGAIKGETK